MAAMTTSIDSYHIYPLERSGSSTNHDDDDEGDADRIDSLHDGQLVDAAGVRASISAKPPRPGPPRRGSLFEAVRRASTFIGDGVCESRKELMLLGVLPEAEDDEESIASPVMDSMQCRRGVPGAILEDETEFYDEYKVRPTDTTFEVRRCTPGPIMEHINTQPTHRDFESEQNEGQAIRASLQAFTFDHPPPPPVQALGEQRGGCAPNYSYGTTDSPFSRSQPPKISREELLWSKVSPSTPLPSPLESDLFRQNLAHRATTVEKLQIYIYGLGIPTRSRGLEDMPDQEPTYERLSTEPAYCTENHLWEGRFPLEWRHYVRSGSL